ncbi:MAG: aminopeptidase [Candidatus Margulisbacteria bacterium GWF2_35_9]|nr:MAG: aminopeptidase [Candidatus Margulisbacteria bacterium GWF2_35_9]
MKEKKKNSKIKKFKKLQIKLGHNNQNNWEMDNLDKKKVETFSQKYMTFITKNKTERETTRYVKKLLEDKGYKENKGKNFYMLNKEKNIAIVRVGKNDLSKGVKLIVSHMDTPHIDLKQNPLYEDTNLAMMKTHYYGGIKKYQWVTRALSLHGIVVLKNGKEVEIRIGDKKKDPVFYIADLLPHLSHKAQNNKKMGEVIDGEKLNILVGSIPYKTDESLKEKIKFNILDILYKKYGIVEEDFLTAELQLVPAEGAREIGFDRSLIGAYGHDDRICSYAAMEAILKAEETNDTYVVLLVDKEEIGSDGNTGAKSYFLKQVIKQIFLNKDGKVDMVKMEDCLFNSKAISGDVNGAIDPDWKEVHESMNAARMGFGVCMTKFTGSGGKYSSSDANAEFVARMRKVLNKNKVGWQIGELGKVDEGGGGTIAKFIASYGMDVVDMGTALLSMHAPMECASKVDLFMTYKAYKVFFEKF